MTEDQFISALAVSNLSKKDTLRRINDYIEHNQNPSCKHLKGRKVRLSKYLEATIPRKDATARMRTFFVGIDIIKKSHIVSFRIHKKLNEYEFVGFDKHGTQIRVHVREEIEKSNKTLYFISSFQT
jgi:hypothetical protein